MVRRSVTSAKLEVESQMSNAMGSIGGFYGLALSRGTETIQAEVDQVQENVDLSREWKIIRRL